MHRFLKFFNEEMDVLRFCLYYKLALSFWYNGSLPKTFFPEKQHNFLMGILHKKLPNLNDLRTITRQSVSEAYEELCQPSMIELFCKNTLHKK